DDRSTQEAAAGSVVVAGEMPQATAGRAATAAAEPPPLSSARAAATTDARSQEQQEEVPGPAASSVDASGPPPPPWKTYTVKGGDSILSICEAQGLSVEELKAWNGLTTDLIYPGRVLVMTPTAPTEDGAAAAATAEPSYP
ncbi:unnamed protein product, partial [Ectocarpus sp. 13 AM-2016]